MRKTSLIVSVLLLVGVIGIVNAQEVLPKGGDSFGTAVKLEPGNYQRDALEENEYFYVAGIKPGQEINIEYTFGAGTGNDGWGILDLYDENRTKLLDEWDTVGKGESQSVAVSWLPNVDEDSYKYYIKTGYDRYDVGPVSFDILLTDYYDAGTQTDAGDSFEKAMSIGSGEYEGYLLSGKKGTDTKDFYKVTVKKGETLTVKVTPPAEVSLSVVVYDSSRKELKEEYSPNPGAIVTNSVKIPKSGELFVAVVCEQYGNKEFRPYSLSIITGAGAKVPGEEEEEFLPGEPTGKEVTGKEIEEAGKAIKTGMGIIIAWLIRAVIGLIVLIVIIVVIVILLRKKKKEKEKKE